jgi:hypothetical protein
MAPKRAILALYTHVDDLLLALRRLKDENHPTRTVFSPLPLPEVQEILSPKTSAVRFIVLLGAILGGSSLVGLAAYAHLSYSLITGGKPVLPWVAWVIVCFEGMVLGGVVAAALSWILKGRLPRLKPQDGYDGAFSRDRFGILVECGSMEQESSLKKLLLQEGAEEVRYVP